MCVGGRGSASHHTRYFKRWDFLQVVSAHLQEKSQKLQKIDQRLNNAVEEIKNTTVGGSVVFSDNKKTLSLQKTRPSMKAEGVVFTILSEDWEAMGNTHPKSC